jgi:ribonuclease E
MWKSMMDRLMGSGSEKIQPVDEPLDLEGLDLDLLKDEEAPAHAKDEAPMRAKAEKQPALADITFDDEPETEEPSAGFVEEDDEEPEAVAEEEQPEEEQEELAAEGEAGDEEDDDYWDALEGLGWEEEDTPEPATAQRGGRRGGRSRPGGRSADKPPREAADKPRREASDKPKPKPVRVAEFLEDDEFGFGLTGEAAAEVKAEAAAEEEEDARRGRGRRRGGRRGRGRDRAREEASAPAEKQPATREELDVSEIVFGEEEEPAERKTPRPERKPVASRPSRPKDEDVEEEAVTEASDEDSEGEFAAGVEGGEGRRRAPRKSPSRGRRGRGGRKTAPEQTPERTPAAEVEEVEDEESAEDIAARAERYRNIPTWEEAISYLVSPKRSASRSGDRGRSGSRGDSGGRGRGGSRGGRGRSRSDSE